MKRILSLAWRHVALVFLYVALWIVGTRLFPVTLGRSPDPAQAVAGLLGCAVIDTVLLGLWASRTRLRGWRRWAALAGAFYGVKTFTSQLEALYFMPNVTGSMAPSLFAMTIPLSLVFPVAVIAAFGDRGPAEGAAWRAPEITLGWKIVDWSVLSAIVYPALFWTAGYFIAFQSPAVRAFYGGLRGVGFFGHMVGVVAADPWVVPFEIVRGALWILMVLPLFRTSKGRWWVDALLAGAFLALVQNDVHLLPNPFMTPEIRLYHFIETSSSNFVWGVVMVGLLRGWREHRAQSRAPSVASLRERVPPRSAALAEEPS